ncbi:MAG: PepSY-like domain-containing protein [Rikenellaceae bacterium]|nr:PepSY-like domain-containing protein [Rikenellaceae bacterium]
MKRVILICAVAIWAVACSKSEDFGVQVSNDTLDAFNDRFPGAKSVSWDKRGVYKVALFSYGGDKLTAWYTQDGVWCMTERTLPEGGIPRQVVNSFQLDEGRTGKSVLRVDHLTRDGIEDIYVMVTGSDGDMTEYYYSEDGIQVKTVAGEERIYDDYRNEIVPAIPSQVLTKVAEQYPNARVMEVDVIFPGIIYVEIIDNLMLKTMEFSLTGAWSVTTWVVSEQFVKTQASDVYDAFLELGYNGNTAVTSVMCCETPTSLYYWFKLDNNGMRTNVKISSDAQNIVVD